MRLMKLNRALRQPSAPAESDTPMHNSPCHEWRFAVTADFLEISARADSCAEAWEGVYIALDTDPFAGSAVLPFRQGAEGSTTFLPMRADRLYFATRRGALIECHVREHERTMWGDCRAAADTFVASIVEGEWRLAIPLASLPSGRVIRVAAYRKNLQLNEGWGHLLASPRFGAKGGVGDQYVSRYESIDLTTLGEGAPVAEAQPHKPRERVRIYQLLPRIFGNLNETRRENGTLAENGVGKFQDVNEHAIAAIRELGCTHVWLTGVLQQATAHGLLRHRPTGR